jgi:alpha-1,2-mannosyltransferase
LASAKCPEMNTIDNLSMRSVLRLDARWLVYGAVGLLAAASIVCGLLSLSAPTKDLSGFLAAGRAVASGQSPYSVADALHGDNPFINPPVYLLIFVPLAGVDPVVAGLAWRMLMVPLYVLALAILVVSEAVPISFPRVIWASSVAAFWTVLQFGQIQVPLLLIVVGAWTLLRRGRFVPAGVLIGLLVAVKPNFAIWPLFLLIVGDVLPALVAFGLATLVSAVAAIKFGAPTYLEFLAADRAFASNAAIGWGNNVSVIGPATRYGVVWAGYAVAVLLLIFVGFLLWQRRPSVTATSGLALVTTVVVSPASWVFYTLLLLPIFARERWSAFLKMGAVLLMMPLILVAINPETGLAYNLAVLIILAGLLLDDQTTKSALLARFDFVHRRLPSETESEAKSHRR